MKSKGLDGSGWTRSASDAEEEEEEDDDEAVLLLLLPVDLEGLRSV